MNSAATTFWALIPAAGAGKRMASKIPKQYLSLAGKTVLQHSVQVLLDHPLISGAVIAVSGTDEYWHETEGQIRRQYPDKKIFSASGGSERCHSVLNGLKTLLQHTSEDDWVLVHDAARPCLRTEDISTLIDTLRRDDVGGLLAVPVSDTIKRSSGENSDRIESTVDRNRLWQAQTPQMFPIKVLKTALEQALDHGYLVTDEASAMEFSGLSPRLVQGHTDNMKITRPEDLALAEFFLQRRQVQAEGETCE